MTVVDGSSSPRTRRSGHALNKFIHAKPNYIHAVVNEFGQPVRLVQRALLRYQLQLEQTWSPDCAISSGCSVENQVGERRGGREARS
jgi:hypothetical protein